MFRMAADFNVLGQFTKYLKKNESLRPILINSLATNDHYKRAFDFISAYNYEATLFPKVIERAMKAGIRYLVGCMTKKMKHGNLLSLPKVMELIDELPAAQALLAEELLNKKNCTAQCAIVCHSFKLWDSMDFLDKSIQHKLSLLKKTKPDMKNKEKDYFGPQISGAYQMPCTEKDVLFISSPFQIDLAAPLLKERLLGIDSEWRPEICKGHSVTTSILQIAGEKTFVIFDLLKLNKEEKLDEFLSKIFSNPAIFKIGLNIQGDITNITSSYPHMKSFHKIESLVELSDISRDLDYSKAGLADIFEHFMKIKLCKTETQSNWENRPLRLCQLHYAIADSYSAVLLVNCFLTEHKISIEDYIYSYSYCAKENKETKKTYISPAKMFSIDIIRESRSQMRKESLIQNNKN